MPTYNYWTDPPPSSVTRDPSLAFDASALKDALSEWREQAGSDAIPSRSTMTARNAKSFLGNLVILERAGERQYRVRLMGTKITAVIGEMQGRLLEEALPPDAVKRWTTWFEMTLTELRPIRLVVEGTIHNLQFLRVEILLAPLLDEGRQATLVFAAVAFTSGSASAAPQPNS
jgi:hypothetical protein